MKSSHFLIIVVGAGASSAATRRGELYARRGYNGEDWRYRYPSGGHDRGYDHGYGLPTLAAIPEAQSF